MKRIGMKLVNMLGNDLLTVLFKKGGIMKSHATEVIQCCFICLLMLLGITWFAGCAQAATLDRWADNIRITEGINSIYPYGIKIKDNMGGFKHYSPFKARIICKRTIWHKWQNYCKLPLKTRQTIDFICYLGNIYCPFIDDPAGNIRWKRNMYKLMKGV